MKTLGYIGAFLGGAIAGAALGILMAPEKGQDTREKITDAIDDFCKKHNINLSKKKLEIWLTTSKRLLQRSQNNITQKFIQIRLKVKE